MIRGILEKLLDLSGVAENVCVVCGLEFRPSLQGYVCEACLEDIRPKPLLKKKPVSFVMDHRVFAPYEGVLAEVIRLYKFKSVKPFSKLLACKVRGYFEAFLKEIEPDIVTYVPAHPFRVWNRGFDHNREIMKFLFPNFESILMRVRHSKPLANLGDPKSRLKAVKDAYKVKRMHVDRLEGKRVLVFDDIVTTGLTASEVAKVLMSCGALEVYFFFLCQES